MAKAEEKKKAIALRKQGCSYSEILKQVPVAKSTLSLWLRSVGLAKRQKQRLTEKKLAAMRRGWETMHLQRLARWQKIKTQAAKEVGSISKRERWLLGVALYWSEGAKEKEYGQSTPIKFSNSDLPMILMFQKWLSEFFGLQRDTLKYELYIHEKADWKQARTWWASRLAIKPADIRVYFKRHNPNPHRKNIGKTYYGLIRIMAPGGSALTRKIQGWVEGICQNCGVV